MTLRLSSPFIFRLAIWLLAQQDADWVELRLVREGASETLVCEAVLEDGSVDMHRIPEGDDRTRNC